MYNVQIAASSAPNDYYDSFVYETIPRNGNGNLYDPNQPGYFCGPGAPCSADDQITIEPSIGADMAWTQYLTSKDTIVRITRRDNGLVDPSNVIIRPTSLGFKTSLSGNALLVTVPFNSRGYRFSVEFQDNLWAYRRANLDADSYYVQNKNPSGVNYVPSYDATNNPIVGVEPLNALMIFMSPFPSSDKIPDLNSAYIVPQGLVSGLDQIQDSVVYFAPGVYWFTGSAQAILSDKTTWVYIAPGAYVKGAIQYMSNSGTLQATGFGVLSGEQYVYQANTQQGFKNIKSDDFSVKMWRAQSSQGAKWTVHGLTLNAPPFNSMDFYGTDLTSFSVDASDYKQVGAFFGQTDGMEMYPGSYVRDAFYHVGDDGIKAYYSNVVCERMTIWKTNNAPIVQFGWYPRTIDNLTVNAIDVIHTRYISQGTPWPRALVASAASYVDQDSTKTADTTQRVSNFKFTNWRCEGNCPAILAFNPLENIDTMLFQNIWIEKLHSLLVGESTIRIFTDGSGKAVALGSNSADGLGLIIENFTVGSTKISFDNNNWQHDQLGRLNIDGFWASHWTVQ